MGEVETLKGLLGRVQATRGPDHQIDADLYAVQEGWDGAAFCQNGEVHRLKLKSREGNRRTYEGEDGQGIDSHELPMFTGSLDYATEMVGRTLPDACLQIDVGAHRDGRRICMAFILLGDHDLGACWGAATAPLAICAALLSALIAQAEQGAPHGE